MAGGSFRTRDGQPVGTRIEAIDLAFVNDAEALAVFSEDDLPSADERNPTALTSEESELRLMRLGENPATLWTTRLVAFPGIDWIELRPGGGAGCWRAFCCISDSEEKPSLVVFEGEIAKGTSRTCLFQGEGTESHVMIGAGKTLSVTPPPGLDPLRQLVSVGFDTPFGTGLRLAGNRSSREVLRSGLDVGCESGSPGESVAICLATDRELNYVWELAPDRVSGQPVSRRLLATFKGVAAYIVDVSRGRVLVQNGREYLLIDRGTGQVWQFRGPDDGYIDEGALSANDAMVALVRQYGPKPRHTLVTWP